MAFKMKEGYGAIFKNEKKENPDHADYTGSCLIAGQECWLNLWVKDKKDKSGKYFSVSIRPKNMETNKNRGYQPKPKESWDPF